MKGKHRFHPIQGFHLLSNPGSPDFLPLKFGSPIVFYWKSHFFFCDTVAVWRIVKLALKNKIYISEIILCSLQDGKGMVG